MSATIYRLDPTRPQPSLEPMMQLVASDMNMVNAVILALHTAGVTARDVQLDSSNLEDAFVKLTGKNLNKEGALA